MELSRKIELFAVVGAVGVRSHVVVLLPELLEAMD